MGDDALIIGLSFGFVGLVCYAGAMYYWFVHREKVLKQRKRQEMIRDQVVMNPLDLYVQQTDASLAENIVAHQTQRAQLNKIVHTLAVKDAQIEQARLQRQQNLSDGERQDLQKLAAVSMVMKAKAMGMDVESMLVDLQSVHDYSDNYSNAASDFVSGVDESVGIDTGNGGGGGGGGGNGGGNGGSGYSSSQLVGGGLGGPSGIRGNRLGVTAPGGALGLSAHQEREMYEAVESGIAGSGSTHLDDVNHPMRELYDRFHTYGVVTESMESLPPILPQNFTVTDYLRAGDSKEALSALATRGSNYRNVGERVQQQARYMAQTGVGQLPLPADPTSNTGVNANLAMELDRGLPRAEVDRLNAVRSDQRQQQQYIDGWNATHVPSNEAVPILSPQQQQNHQHFSQMQDYNRLTAQSEFQSASAAAMSSRGMGSQFIGQSTGWGGRGYR
jgi:hypothetical protein